MASTFVELTGKLSGPVESEDFSLESDAEINIGYSSDKCYSAWVEATLPNSSGIVRFPFLPPHPRNSKIILPSGSSAKVVASIGFGGSLKATLIY